MAETLDSVMSCMVITNPLQTGHPVVFATKGFAETVGYHRDELLGRSIFQVALNVCLDCMLFCLHACSFLMSLHFSIVILQKQNRAAALHQPEFDAPAIITVAQFIAKAAFAIC